MDANALSSIPEIITAASKSPFGLVALAVVALTAVALIFFKKDKGWHKIAAFGFMVTGATAFTYALLQVQRDDAARQVSAASTIRDLRLHLVFDVGSPIHPMDTTVRVLPYIQHSGEMEEKLVKENVRFMRGAGGLVVNFTRLSVGDRLYVVVEDHGRRWRSDDMQLPEAQLAMSAIQP